MRTEKINQILKEQVELIKPSEETHLKISKISKEFCKELNNKLRINKIKAEVFIGGSIAKDTLIKKDKYDVDVFVRFSEEYKEDNISRLLGRVVGKNARKVHGSRDYYQLEVKGIVMEVIPVIKIKKPSDAHNITDLSYFHVRYILDKIKKNKNLTDEIRLAKKFTYAQNVYGAESYIHGFSGYALELLVSHYGSFLKFIKGISGSKEKLIIDDAKFYKNKKEVLIELNESKLNSPIILIDPTFKERNALAGLNEYSFNNFIKSCKEFLKNPDIEFFKRKDILNEFKKYKNLKIVKVKTDKQKGDISGTKSKKFFYFFIFRLKKEFEIKKAGFNYNENENLASFYFVLDKKKEEIVKGPPIKFIDNVKRFKKVHKNSFVKNKIIYAKIKHNLNFDNWFKRFLKDDKKIIKEMNIKEVKKAN